MGYGKLRFDGRVAIVTGAARGLGLAYCEELCRRGARVVLNDLDASIDGAPSSVEAVAEALTAEGHQARAIVANVADPAAGEAIVRFAEETFGAVDILVHNAGLVRFSDFPKTSDDDLDVNLGVHAAALFYLARAVWPGMKGRGYGRVVTTVSTALYGSAPNISYVAGKGAGLGLMKSLAEIGKDQGIKVNAIAPVAFTSMTPTAALTAEQLRDRRALLAPQKVAQTVALLCHEACPCTCEILLSAGDRVARIFLGETRGYLSAGRTAETILANWADVMDRTGHIVGRPQPLGQGFRIAELPAQPVAAN